MKFKHCLIAIVIGISYQFAFGNDYNFGHIDYSEGLSHNHVQCFAEDNNGFLWIGTRSGLNRYDGYTFKIFKNNPSDSVSLPDNTVQSITKDQLGRFWLGLQNQMCIFNPNTEQFTADFNFINKGANYQLYNIDLVVPYGDSTLFLRVPEIGIIEHNLITNTNLFIEADENDPNSLTSNNIAHIAVYGQHLCVTQQNGLIEIFDVKTHQVIKRINMIKKLVENSLHQYQVFVDTDLNIWFYSNDAAFGLFRADPEGNVNHFNTESKPALNSNLISSIVQDHEGKFWIGTDHGGINILSPDLKNIIFKVNENHNENSLSQNVITALYEGINDIIWIGTFKQGINYYHENLFRFLHYVNYPNIEITLPYNDVNCFAEDKLGNLWIGTNGVGLIYFDRKQNKFNHFKANPGKKNQLQSNVVVSLLVDKNNNLWVGTYHGGLSLYNGKEFINYTNDPDNPKSIANNIVWDVYEDTKGNIWIGFLGGGLDMFNRNENAFYHYRGKGMNSIGSDFVMDITEDDEGNIWFGTENGVFVLDNTTSRFISFTHDSKTPGSLSDNFVYNVFKDSNGNIWAGTRDGLNLYNKEKSNFINFNVSDGLPDNSIMSILESDFGDLWLGTSNGLCKLSVDYDLNGKYLSHYTVNYTESDGIQGREFNEGSAIKTKNGELIFGGSNGFNLFIPNNEKDIVRNNPTHIFGLEIFGQIAGGGQNTKREETNYSAVLDGETIQLNYAENMFSIKYVTIDFLSAKKINYRYKLIGFNNQWIYTTWQDRKATFTNLSPGKYKFVVQSSDNLSEWEDSENFLNIVIRPPWYKTLIAYIFYIIGSVLTVLLLRRIMLNRERNLLLKEQAIKESERQHELNVLKTRFFTNVSHEFRTPLTLILTPLQGILKTDLDKNTKKHLELVYQNANRLMVLVNQLLDFRKAEEKKLKLNLIYGDIIKHIQNTVDSFSDLAHSKNIDLKYLSFDSELFMRFDRDKIEKIITNLLSNAFKFTAPNGSITVSTKVTVDDMVEMLDIKVEDKGIGIRQEEREKLFERFYQANLPADLISSGSGIGLSLTKEFVEMHHGSISVSSEPGMGSCFTILLPINRQRIKSNVQEENQEQLPSESEIETGSFLTTEIDAEKKTILIVEDNDEFRGYLKDSLFSEYNILEAENGQLAMELLEIEHPDLIISDIMMPVMDGIQLCNTIKTDAKFSHIPIILLTAKSTLQDRITGLKTGADEYITKPFNLDILKSRIVYLMGLREKFIKEYQKTFKVETNNLTITPIDQKLLNQTLDLINKNMIDSDFNVEKLSAELGISRVYLYKKLSSLTGKTPVELIRSVKLRKASELLIKSQLSISEIAYEVGFNDPRYFSKQFKNEFNMLPTTYREKAG